MQTLFPASAYAEAFTITPSDTVDIVDDPNNKTGVSSVFIHNPDDEAVVSVRVMPAGQRVPPVITLSGTSGTANINIKGVDYLVTFSSSLATTASNFVTTHANKLQLAGVRVKNLGNDLRFIGAGIITITNASGNLTGAAPSPSPVTVSIPSGGVLPLAVSRVYATTPTAPSTLIGFFGGSR